MTYKFCIFRCNVETQNLASVRTGTCITWWALLFVCAVSYGNQTQNLAVSFWISTSGMSLSFTNSNILLA